MVLVHLHVHDACPCPCCTSMILSMFSPVHHRSVCLCECMFVFMCVLVCIFVCVFVCINAVMPDCPASDQSGTRLKKLTMLGIVRHKTKPRQSGIFLVQYRTEIIDVGMPMPALVSLMPINLFIALHTIPLPQK
jgi:hypothetical protein